MALHEIDRSLLERCLNRQPGGWEAFVDRFLGLVIHVVNHTAASRSIQIGPEDREDLAAEVFLAIVQNDFAVMRQFRGDSSLATYLTVIARRVVVREMLKRKHNVSLVEAPAAEDSVEQRITQRDEVELLLKQLQGPEAEIVRRFHLQGQSYRQISEALGVPENSVGPTLSRARAKLRRLHDSAAVN